MPFVKIGDKWFNPNLVTDIQQQKNGIYTLYFSAPSQKGHGDPVVEARNLEFRGQEAELFKDWLSEHEIDPSDDQKSAGQGSEAGTRDHVGF